MNKETFKKFKFIKYVSGSKTENYSLVRKVTVEMIWDKLSIDI